MRNFGLFIGVDWSGAKNPVNTKSIAFAACTAGDAPPVLDSSIRSRSAVYERLERLIKGKKRTLAGIDCNFGFAESIGEKLLGPRYTARDLWDTVEGYSADEDNFFAGGFWSHSDISTYFWTIGKMPDGFRMPQRITETVCSECGFGKPESPFKLIGAKQVGKGGFAGMRMAYALKQRHGDAVAIWPFDPPETCDAAVLVITEIYPRQFIRRCGFGNRKIRDRDSLNAALTMMSGGPVKRQIVSDHDSDAMISAAGIRYLCGPDTTLPHNLALPPGIERRILTREGWIFGAGFHT